LGFASNLQPVKFPPGRSEANFTGLIPHPSEAIALRNFGSSPFASNLQPVKFPPGTSVANFTGLVPHPSEAIVHPPASFALAFPTFRTSQLRLFLSSAL
jgi:hypothetical protein